MSGLRFQEIVLHTGSDTLGYLKSVIFWLCAPSYSIKPGQQDNHTILAGWLGGPSGRSHFNVLSPW